ncbi:MAG: hypothetical protein R2694_13780 [Ilumatobacteraceae bacterium]
MAVMQVRHVGVGVPEQGVLVHTACARPVNPSSCGHERRHHLQRGHVIAEERPCDICHFAHDQRLTWANDTRPGPAPSGEIRLMARAAGELRAEDDGWWEYRRVVVDPTDPGQLAHLIGLLAATGWELDQMTGPGSAMLRRHMVGRVTEDGTAKE